MKRNDSIFGGHGKNYNQVYCDGHVSAMNPSLMYNLSLNAPMWNNDHLPHRERWGQP